MCMHASLCTHTNIQQQNCSFVDFNFYIFRYKILNGMVLSIPQILSAPILPLNVVSTY
jgi:hypothetical protein